MSDKRKQPSATSLSAAGSSSGTGSSALVKRARQDDGDERMQMTISANGRPNDKGLIRSVKRTSSLQAPIVALSGAHTAELLDVKFSPDGQMIAAASSDRTISIWQTFGDNVNIGILSGHSKAVTSICWSSSAPQSAPRLFSASADGTLIVWDVLSGSKVRRLRGHKAIVNCVACARASDTDEGDIIASGGDDGKVMLWSTNERSPLDVISVGYPVTALCFSEDGSQIFVGGLDNQIHSYDLLRKQIIFSLLGHTETITSLVLSPSGGLLLSAAMDNTLRLWDVQPFAAESRAGQTTDVRLQKTFTGAATSGFENLLIKAAWSKDARRVALGGTDRSCTIWE